MKEITSSNKIIGNLIYMGDRLPIKINTDFEKTKIKCWKCDWRQLLIVSDISEKNFGWASAVCSKCCRWYGLSWEKRVSASWLGRQKLPVSNAYILRMVYILLEIGFVCFLVHLISFYADFINMVSLRFDRSNNRASKLFV